MTRRRLGLILVASTCAALTPAAAVAAAGSSPSVGTGGATTTHTSATVHGTVNPNGSSTTYRFQYGTTKAYGDETSSLSVGSGTRAVAVARTIGGLRSGTVYHYRIVASNARGTSAGADRSFKTTGNPPPPPPVAATGATTNVDRHAATLVGAVDPRGNTTTYHFELGLTSLYGLQTPDQTASGTGGRFVSYGVTGLEASTTYHFRIVASSVGGTTVGADQTFRTGPFNAFGLSASTTPRVAPRAPYRFTTTGHLRAPGNQAEACRGRIVVRFLNGRHSVAHKTVHLGPDCKWGSAVTVIRHHLRLRHLRVFVRFYGNDLIAPKQSHSEVVRIGR